MPGYRPPTAWNPCYPGPGPDPDPPDPTPPQLVRTADGLLVFDDFTQMPDGPLTGYREPHPDWYFSRESTDGRPLDEVWRIENGALVYALDPEVWYGDYNWLIRDGLDPRSQVVAQVRARVAEGDDGGFGALGRFVELGPDESLTEDQQAQGIYGVQNRRGDSIGLYIESVHDDYEMGSAYPDPDEAPAAPDGISTQKIEILNAPNMLTDLWARIHSDPVGSVDYDFDNGDFWSEGFLATWPAAGAYGIWLNIRDSGNAAVLDFAAYRANQVRVLGLPDGAVVRIGDMTATADGGEATIELGAVTCPLPKVEVLDAEGALLAEAAPEDGVWGGDEYTYTPGES